MVIDWRNTRFPTGPDGEAVAIGTGGWAVWEVPPFKHDIRLRLIEDKRGRFVIHSLWAEAYPVNGQDGSIAPADLRDIALGRIESVLNTPGFGERLRDAFSATEGPSYDPRSVSQIEMFNELAGLPLAEAASTLKVELSNARRLPDEFYRQVAEVYGMAVSTRSRRPARDIAAANGVPPTTVHRWIKEARRRGVLSAAPRRSEAVAEPDVSETDI